jgi:hypothetical protein
MHWNVVVNRHLAQAAASGGTLAGTRPTEVTLLLEISKSYWAYTNDHGGKWRAFNKKKGKKRET